MLVHGQPGPGRMVDPERAQQRLAVTRVLTSHCVHELQHMQGAQADIGKIANGRGHHIQAAFRIILCSRCRMGCGAGGIK